MRLVTNTITIGLILFFSNAYPEHQAWNNPDYVPYYTEHFYDDTAYYDQDHTPELDHSEYYDNELLHPLSFDKNGSNGQRDTSTGKDFYYFKRDKKPTAKRFYFRHSNNVNSLSLSSLDVDNRRIPKPTFSRTRSDSNIKARQALALSKSQCHRRLRQHRVKFTALRSVWGVKVPVKISSSIGGVRYRQTNHNSKASVMDCRLAVALLAWSKLLKQHSVYEVVYMRTYTPGATVKGTNRRSGHSGGLAIDIAKFKSRRYGELNIKYDWSDQRRKISPCIKSPSSAQALRLLRAIVCSTAQQQLFALILTPHYNRAHHDHLHMELRPSLRKLVLR